MKISNLKINQKSLAKIAAFALAGTVVTGALTGCSTTFTKNKDGLLEDTRLENTRVITFGDGTKDIATCFGTTMCSYDHYHSIVSGDYYVASNHVRKAEDIAKYHYYDITSDISIVYYLTDEEKIKANKGELTDDDIDSIINRIVDPITETKSK